MVATSWSCMGIAIYFALVVVGLVAAFVFAKVFRGIKLI